MHAFTLYLYFFKYLYVVTSVNNDIIIYTVDHPLHINPLLNLPVSTSIAAEEFFIQYDHNKYIVLIFYLSTQ